MLPAPVGPSSVIFVFERDTQNMKPDQQAGGPRLDTAESVETEVERMIAVLDDCLSRNRAGEALDLTGLDDRIAALCNACESLPREQAEPLSGRFQVLLDRFDTLASALEKN